jgi:hypothetical protein
MEESEMGGVNYCSLHCRLAKFRGSMIVVKYGAAIGRETLLFVCAQLQIQAMGFLKPITAPHLTTIIKPRNFAKRQCKLQCKLQWLAPSTESDFV